MKAAVVLRPFKRSDTKENVKVGRRFEADNDYIKELSRSGLVRELAVNVSRETKVDPNAATGKTLSASPAGRVSRKKTSRRLSDGVQKTQAEKLL
jgi:hypothetical protein